jgi:4-hydroxy-2-oxoheptanedioate aldolase
VTRINRAIELLEQGQPIYYVTVPDEQRTFEGGVAFAHTWADYISYDVEHAPFDMTRLSQFMKGLVAAGPTRSGHRCPPVIVSLPAFGTDEMTVRVNAWHIQQVLATGAHGLLLPHVESLAAGRAFVEAARYPFHRAGVGEGLDEGRRGDGGQRPAAAIWGTTIQEYLQLADPWPLNPKGELMLGLKVEDKRGLAKVEESLQAVGVSFVEWGPGDMGKSMGFPDNHDEPHPPEMVAAKARIFAAAKANNLFFLNAVTPANVTQRLDEGVMICFGGPAGEECARIGRQHTGRTMPW